MINDFCRRYKLKYEEHKNKETNDVTFTFILPDNYVVLYSISSKYYKRNIEFNIERKMLDTIKYECLKREGLSKLEIASLMNISMLKVDEYEKKERM